jgi:hypothetical protein
MESYKSYNKLFLYISVSSDLTEAQIREIDLQVKQNQEVLCLSVKQLPVKSKRIVKRLKSYTILLFILSQPLVPCATAGAVMLPISTGIHTLSYKNIQKDTSNKHFYPKIAQIDDVKRDKLILTNPKKFDIDFNSDPTMEELILELRGGGVVEFFIVILTFVTFMKFYGADAFLQIQNPMPLPQNQPGFSWENNPFRFKNVDPYPYRSSSMGPTTAYAMHKPSSMPQTEYSGLTKSERRQLPDPMGRDRAINIEGYPKLELRYNQIYYKTPKHGQDHGLPVGANDKTPKTESNALALRDSLLEMPNKEDIIWYTDGQYQGGTERGCASVNLYDPETGVIAVYAKQSDGSNLFLTTCTLTDKEIDHLESTNGNFVTQKILEQQNWVKNDIIFVNPMYENNLMDKNKPMDANSSPGFTSINSFESDVMGITPIDNSEFNNLF